VFPGHTAANDRAWAGIQVTQPLGPQCPAWRKEAGPGAGNPKGWSQQMLSIEVSAYQVTLNPAAPVTISTLLIMKLRQVAPPAWRPCTFCSTCLEHSFLTPPFPGRSRPSAVSSDSCCNPVSSLRPLCGSLTRTSATYPLSSALSLQDRPQGRCSGIVQ
jgi:hypothetical protein